MAHISLEPLGHEDRLHLRAAQGWIELGLPLEADKELDEITAALRSHPDVLEVRWHVYAHAEKWEACVDIAAAIIKLAPERSSGWIHRSFALHELQRTQEAFDQLLPAAENFSKGWTIPYNLACYCCQLGRLKECEQWFQKAIAIDNHAVQKAECLDADGMSEMRHGKSPASARAVASWLLSLLASGRRLERVSALKNPTNFACGI